MRYTEKLVLRFKRIRVIAGQSSFVYEEYVNCEAEGGDDATYRYYLGSCPRWEVGTGWFQVSEWSPVEDSDRISELERQRMEQTDKIEASKQQLTELLEGILKPQPEEWIEVRPADAVFDVDKINARLEQRGYPYRVQSNDDALPKPAPLIEVSAEMTAACLSAIKVWGQSEQLVQSMGECGEFLDEFGDAVKILGRYIATVGRHFQGRDPDLDAITEEAADVVILMLQVRELVGQEKFDSALRKKFEKFSTKVSTAKSQIDRDGQPN